MRRYLARQFARPSGWIGRYLIGPWLDRISRSMSRLALSELALERDDRVLEVGFGGGDLLADILAATDGGVFGADVSEAMVERARRRLRTETGRLSLFLASAEAVPLPDGSIDKAVSLNSLYFWPDPGAALAEMARLVRPGGRLVLCFEPPDELRKWPGSRFGFRMFEAEDVAALMDSAGFGALRTIWGEGRKPDRFCCLSGERRGANG